MLRPLIVALARADLIRDGHLPPGDASYFWMLPPTLGLLAATGLLLVVPAVRRGPTIRLHWALWILAFVTGYLFLAGISLMMEHDGESEALMPLFGQAEPAAALTVLFGALFPAGVCFFNGWFAARISGPTARRSLLFIACALGIMLLSTILAALIVGGGWLDSIGAFFYGIPVLALGGMGLMASGWAAAGFLLLGLEDHADGKHLSREPAHEN